MPASRRIEPLAPGLADELVSFWRDNGFDEDAPGEGLAAALDPEEEAAWIRGALDAGGECGRVIHGDEGLIGYAKYGPADIFGARAGGIASRVSADSYLLAGLCVAPWLAGRGFGKLLLGAVETDLHKRGVTALEAFASKGEAGRPTALRPVGFYERHGFRVRAPDTLLPIVRLDLKGLAVWTENLDAVLERLLAAGVAALPRRAPAPTGTWPATRHS